jgi:hypothetical protein
MPRPRRYPEELIDRGVRLVPESGPPIAHVTADDQVYDPCGVLSDLRC